MPSSLAFVSYRRADSSAAARWSKMGRLGFVRACASRVRYPSPMVTLSERTPRERAEGLARLPGWKVVVSDAAGGPLAQRTERTRTFEFASFTDAIRFMSEAVPVIESMQHHARWENIWRSVSVHLSTRDIGHKPSRLDLELAARVQALRPRFPNPRGGL